MTFVYVLKCHFVVNITKYIVILSLYRHFLQKIRTFFCVSFVFAPWVHFFKHVFFNNFFAYFSVLFRISPLFYQHLIAWISNFYFFWHHLYQSLVIYLREDFFHNRTLLWKHKYLSTNLFSFFSRMIWDYLVLFFCLLNRKIGIGILCFSKEKLQLFG